jgi:hypothetical protein
MEWILIYIFLIRQDLQDIEDFYFFISQMEMKNPMHPRLARFHLGNGQKNIL